MLPGLTTPDDPVLQRSCFPVPKPDELGSTSRLHTPRTPRRLRQPRTGGWRRSGCCLRTMVPLTKTCGAASAARPCASCAGGSALSCSQIESCVNLQCCLCGIESLWKPQNAATKLAYPLIMRVPRLSAAPAALSSGISPLLCACDRPLLFFLRLLQSHSVCHSTDPQQ